MLLQRLWMLGYPHVQGRTFHHHEQARRMQVPAFSDQRRANPFCFGFRCRANVSEASGLHIALFLMSTLLRNALGTLGTQLSRMMRTAPLSPVSKL